MEVGGKTEKNRFPRFSPVFHTCSMKIIYSVQMVPPMTRIVNQTGTKTGFIVKEQKTKNTTN